MPNATVTPKLSVLLHQLGKNWLKWKNRHDRRGKIYRHAELTVLTDENALAALRPAVEPPQFIQDFFTRAEQAIAKDRQNWERELGPRFDQAEAAYYDHPFPGVTEWVALLTGVDRDEIREAAINGFGGHERIVDRLQALDSSGETRDLWDKLVRDHPDVLREARLIEGTTGGKRVKGKGTEEAVPSGEGQAPTVQIIPTGERTIPMSFRKAAKYMGKGDTQDAAEWMSARVRDGKIPREELSRQSGVFSVHSFPASVRSKIIPR